MLAATVLPRAFAAGEPATGGTPFKVLTINLFGRADAQAVVELVRRLQPDVFSALELTYGQVDALEAAGLAELMPYRVLRDERGASGSGLYGRHPLTPNARVLPPFITIDHVLADKRARVRAVEVLDVPRTDHRGVFAELRLPF